jgi:hypothetical protein
MREIYKTYNAVSNTRKQEHPFVTHVSIDKEAHAYSVGVSC